MLRTQRARLFAVTLGAALAVATPAPAGAEDTQPAVVVNGTFSSPTVPAGQNWLSAPIEGWGGNLVFSAGYAAHPRGFQAAALSTADSTDPLSTRVRGVRAGSTVTVSWDDTPDKCMPQGGAKRTYTVTVAGAANAPGAFATNTGTGAANWFVGRTYSFTAAEDAPKITFSFDSTNSSPGCRALITNVDAKQTAAAQTPALTDPCAGDAASSPQCKDIADNKTQINKCPASNRDCLASVAGDGKAEKDGIAKETKDLEDFNKVPRDQDPNTAAAGLCALPNALTDPVKPGDAVVPPKDWWFC